MTTYAAMLTGKGAGPIAAIQLYGEIAGAVLKNIFSPVADKPLELTAGRILLGSIKSSEKTIDQVTIGCDSENCFTINSHGNPIIVGDILTLLKNNNVTIVASDALAALRLAKTRNAIEIEAQQTIPKAKTLLGTKIIQYQTTGGLAKTAAQWLYDIESLSLDLLRSNAAEILVDSELARPVIFGCKTVITGPPGAGKSSLLNYLAGSAKSIVSGSAGTTRDYVTASCAIGGIIFDLYDTAGLDTCVSERDGEGANDRTRGQILPPNGESERAKDASIDRCGCGESIDSISSEGGESIERTAQNLALELLDSADLVILMLDNSRTIDQLDPQMLKKITAGKYRVVINKIDLPKRLDTDLLGKILGVNPEGFVYVSLREQKNLQQILSNAIEISLFEQPHVTCFTKRQENILSILAATDSKEVAKTAIERLLDSKDLL